MLFDPGQRFRVRCNQCPAGTGFHREVTKRHALFNGERVNGTAAVFNDHPQGAARGDFAQNREHEIFGG